MNPEIVFPRIVDKKYINNFSIIYRMLIKSIIGGVVLLVLSYVFENVIVVDFDVLIFVYIYLLYVVLVIINSIRRVYRFRKFCNSYIIFDKEKKDLMMYCLNSFKIGSVKAILGSMAGNAIGGTSGAAIQVASAVVNKKEVKNTYSDVKYIGIPNNLTIDNVINDPKTYYEYYKDVKLIRDTKSYYVFMGNEVFADGVEKNVEFKIYKFYYGIDSLKEYFK